MSGGLGVDPAALDRIAGTLRHAGITLEGAAAAPPAPDAGAMSGLVAAALAMLAEQGAQISEGVAGAGDAVAAGGQRYLEMDAESAAGFGG